MMPCCSDGPVSRVAKRMHSRVSADVPAHDLEAAARFGRYFAGGWDRMEAARVHWLAMFGIHATPRPEPETW